MTHLAIMLMVEYILFLILLRGLSFYAIIYPNFYDGKHFNNSIAKYFSRPGALFLTFCRFLIFVFLSYTLSITYYFHKSVDWNIYTSYTKFLGTFYFFLVTILSVWKVYCCPQPEVNYPLCAPRLTAFVNNLFNTLVPVAFVSTALSVFIHWGTDVVYEDHLITLTCFFEMFLNTFRVGGGDIFFCVSFALLYIGFVWVTSAFLEISDWPHNRFKMKTKWCAASYNAFVFAHVVSFVFYYILMKYICFTPVFKAKVMPQGYDNINDVFLETPPSNKNGDDDEVVHFPPNRKGDESDLHVQDIESSGEIITNSQLEPEPELKPEPEPVAEMKETPTVDHDALIAQMIAERTEKKKVLAESEQLKLELQALKERNSKDRMKLEKVVGRLSERELQLKNLEMWLSAKNDEELSKIKMQMADKLNDLSLNNRPKSARGGDVELGHTSALLDMDAKDPVQTKNLQALSALRKMKEKKFAKVDDTPTAFTDIDIDSKKDKDSQDASFNMYKTM